LLLVRHGIYPLEMRKNQIYCMIICKPLESEYVYILRLLQKYQMFTLPNPSHQGRGTHPYTPLKRGFTLSPCGRGQGRVRRVRGKIDFCKILY